MNESSVWFIFLAGEIDIIDEAIQYFKANIFFKNFEIKVFIEGKKGFFLLYLRDNFIVLIN